MIKHHKEGKTTVGDSRKSQWTGSLLPIHHKKLDVASMIIWKREEKREKEVQKRLNGKKHSKKDT